MTRALLSTDVMLLRILAVWIGTLLIVGTVVLWTRVAVGEILDEDRRDLESVPRDERPTILGGPDAD